MRKNVKETKKTLSLEYKKTEFKIMKRVIIWETDTNDTQRLNDVKL